MGNQKDFLDEMVAERVGQNPEFPLLLDEAVAHRELLRDREPEGDTEHPSATQSRDREAGSRRRGHQ